MATSLAQRRLASALKQLRARSGMSAAELGRVLGWTQTRVSRTENGGRRISLAEAASWADATSAPPDLRTEVVALAEDAARDVRSWWSVHTGGMAGRQHEVAALEASATTVRNCQLHIPGLLQTADYARQAMARANVSGQDDLTAAVAARMRRQDVLYDPARQFEYVLPESALHLRFSGDQALMRAQADRLLSLDTLPNVSIAVLPFSVPAPTLPLAFVIYEIPGEPLVLVENLTSEVLTGDEGEVAVYREAFTRLRTASVTGDDAHRLIRSAMTSEDQF
jgi:transcriptional regulator with XRE-family HTH domain